MIRKVLFLGFTFILLTVLLLWIGTNLFKNPTILEATLEDDLSRMELILKKNNRFELSIISPFNKESIQGNYQREGARIIMLNRSGNLDFIADTLLIFGDKLVFGKNWIGQPKVEFGHYFQIEKNLLQPLP
jgi:hypothetical protein